ncbi:MAG: rhomboid family intramembrane serine protease [Parachlamydiaceae bacterium]
MRLIGTLDDEKKASIFSHFLNQHQILHQIEIQHHHDWASHSYGQTHCQFWIQDENHIEDVLKWFQLFLAHPEDPLFADSHDSFHHIQLIQPLNLPSKNLEKGPQSTSPPWDKQPMGWMTQGLLVICTLLFVVSHIILPSLQTPEKFSGLTLFTSPIERTLLYDYPKFYALINRFVRLYGYEELETRQDLPPEGIRLIKQINNTPVWPGFYQLLLKGGWQSAKQGLTQYPTFEKIQEGQIWRLFTPCLLHGDLLHLFFNMLWLIVLGKQIEQRLPRIRYVIFILIAGIASNTAQYLMSGSNFVGLSGVLIGMLTFIWVRQRVAAWEGYQIDRSTFAFMLLFILGMAAIQLFSFFIEKSFEWSMAPNIANMAHLIGGATGFLLGRLNFFSWRHN